MVAAENQLRLFRQVREDALRADYEARKAAFEAMLKAPFDERRYRDDWERRTFGLTLSEMDERYREEAEKAEQAWRGFQNRMRRFQEQQAAKKLREQQITIMQSLISRLGLRSTTGQEATEFQPIGASQEVSDLLRALYRLLSDGLVVEMSGQKVGNIVGKQQAERGALLAQMGGFA